MRIKGTVTCEAVSSLAASPASMALAAGSAYSVLTIFPFVSYAYGFNVRPAVGQRVVGLDTQYVVGFQVPAKPGGGNGFFPIAESTGPGQALSITVAILQSVATEERLAHANNGARTDVYAAGCQLTYTYSGTTYIARDSAHGYVPGQTPGVWDAFGISASVVAFSSNGYFFPPVGPPVVAYGMGDMECSWSLGFVDASDNPLFANPAVPAVSSAAGSSSWGSVIAAGITAPGGPPMVPTDLRRKTVSLSIRFIPTHAFDVVVDPIGLIDNSNVAQRLRIEREYFNPLTTGSSATGTDVEGTGGTYTYTCGGTWAQYAHTAEAYNGAAWINDGASLAVTSNGLLPLLQRVTVTNAVDHSGLQHYYCHVRAPFNAMGISQAGSVNIPGTSGLTVLVGTPQTITVNSPIGYRYLRVTARTAAGTGSLAVVASVNGISSAALGTLTTVTAGVPVDLDIDLLQVPGLVIGEQLTLGTLGLTASGATITVDSIVAIRLADHSIMTVLGRRRAQTPLEADSEAAPILQCWTDGVLSLLQIASPPQIKSATPRNLVHEINGTTPHSYGSWSPGGYWTSPTPAVTSPVALLGWSALEIATPRVGKTYGSNDVLPISDWSDSDIYIEGLGGDGIVGGLQQIGLEAGVIQAQRQAHLIEPGWLPGQCGFNGDTPEPFGVADTDEHGVTTIRFLALIGGGAHGCICPSVPGGPVNPLPIEEDGYYIADLSVTGYHFEPLPVPVPRGEYIPGADKYALSEHRLRGMRTNYYPPLTGQPAGLVGVSNNILNPGGTPTTWTVNPRMRELAHARLWYGESDPVRWIDSLIEAHLGFWCRAWTTEREVLFVRSGGGIRGETDVIAPRRIAPAATGTEYGQVCLWGRRQCQLVAWFSADSGTGWSCYESASDDDGATWSTPERVSETGVAALYPRIAMGTGDSIGGAIHYWWEQGADVGGLPAGKLLGQFVAPGMDFDLLGATYLKTIAGADLVVAHGPTDMVQSHAGQCVWVLSCVIAGETAISEWRCANETLLRFERII